MRHHPTVPRLSPATLRRMRAEQRQAQIDTAIGAVFIGMTLIGWLPLVLLIG